MNAIELREKLAELAHKQWSGWIEYMFNKSLKDFHNATLIIPKWAVERWGRQASTPYGDLSEEEKDSDRIEADKFLAIFQETLLAEPCEWTDETIPRRRQGQRKFYKTSCGKAYSIVGGLRFEFCPFCGKPIKEIR